MKTLGGPSRSYNWEQYFNLLHRDRAFQVVEEFVVQHSYPDYYKPESLDPTYSRQFLEIETVENVVDDVKTQLLNQLKGQGVEFKQFVAGNFDESLEEAILQTINNFGDIEKYILVQLDEDEFLLSPVDRESLVIKILSPDQVQLVVYKPKQFVLFHVGLADE